MKLFLSFITVLEPNMADLSQIGGSDTDTIPDPNPELGMVSEDIEGITGSDGESGFKIKKEKVVATVLSSSEFVLSNRIPPQAPNMPYPVEFHTHIGYGFVNSNALYTHSIENFKESGPESAMASFVMILPHCAFD